MATTKQKAEQFLSESVLALSRASVNIDAVIELSKVIKSSLKNGGKVIAFGNGGSASDAEHLAAELVVRFQKDRPAMAALALSCNSSVITAAANDFSYSDIFARQIEALALAQDVVLAITTSGMSENVLRAAAAAKKKGCYTAGLTGKDGGKLKSLVDLCLIAPSDKTADIQVCHIALIHLLCMLIENTDIE